jgi:hypothetical protein
LIDEKPGGRRGYAAMFSAACSGATRSRNVYVRIQKYSRLNNIEVLVVNYELLHAERGIIVTQEVSSIQNGKGGVQRIVGERMISNG